MQTSAKYILHPIGLHNLGNSCYLNAMMQALLSAPAICSWIAVASGIYDAPVLRELAAVLHNMIYPPSRQHVTDLAGFSQHFFGDGIRNGRQEDANECLHRIIKVLHEPTAALGPQRSLESRLEVRHSGSLVCSCGRTSALGEAQCPAEPWVELPRRATYGDAAAEREITSEQEFVEYILGNNCLSRDHKCEACGAANTTTKHYKLARISQVLIVLFKKYDAKYVQYFPQRFTIPGDVPKHYEIVAQVEQSGGRASGHYYAYGRRISDSTSAVEQRTAAYLLNDSYVERRSGFAPSENTYMVVYSRAL